MRSADSNPHGMPACALARDSIDRAGRSTQAADTHQVKASTLGSPSPQAGKVPLDATVGEDVEEAQELPMNPARGSHYAWEEGVTEGEGSVMPVGVPVTVVLHLRASHWTNHLYLY